jgi:energy-coupling factor transporter transmembrane protein EcfT
MAISKKDRREFHPAVSISSWLIFAVAVELTSPHQLLWLALAAGFLILHRLAWQRFVRLLLKAKWLWLALILLYAFTFPGVYVWQGAYSPTYEGLQAGGLRVARLVLLLAALARLLAEFSPQQLAGGLYLLAKPLDWFGFDRRALAVRLALTLEHMEGQPKKRNWLEELKSPVEAAAGPEEIRLAIPSAGPHDAGVLMAACLMLGTSLI